MCGRYVTISKVKTIEKRFNVFAPEPVQYIPNTNISHGNIAPVITNEKPNELQFFQFGFTPSWATKNMYIVNARAEGDHNKENDPKYVGALGIISKPMFRSSIRSKRCLIPADAFIEGPEKERLNKPYLIYKRDGDRPFAFAGIWDNWVNRETGEFISSFAIITTVSNSITHKINHHRSPIILPREVESAWIDSSLSLSEVTELLQPFPGEELNAYPISIDIKKPTSNGLHLLEPTGERIIKEHDYIIYEDIRLEGMGMTTARKRKNEGEQGLLF
ncbi:MAG: SOS response-associated peptidase [Flavobacteriales bacterium]|nr:SOS response-associated peptidase [Flavobacteriales bacterium]